MSGTAPREGAIASGAVLRVSALTGAFGGLRAVDGVSFAVEAG